MKRILAEDDDAPQGKRPRIQRWVFPPFFLLEFERWMDGFWFLFFMLMGRFESLFVGIWMVDGWVFWFLC